MKYEDRHSLAGACRLDSTRRLHEAAVARGHQARVIDTLKLAIDDQGDQGDEPVPANYPAEETLS